MNKNLLILGAGQYGMVAREIAESMGSFEKIDFLDDHKEFAIDKLTNYEKYAAEYSVNIFASFQIYYALNFRQIYELF